LTSSSLGGSVGEILGGGPVDRGGGFDYKSRLTGVTREADRLTGVVFGATG
jgi:hypothetical protein